MLLSESRHPSFDASCSRIVSVGFASGATLIESGNRQARLRAKEPREESFERGKNVAELIAENGQYKEDKQGSRSKF